MRSRSTAPVVFLALVVAVATPVTAGAPVVRHSGTVADIDAESRVLILDEVGRWRVERDATVAAAALTRSAFGHPRRCC